MTRILSVDPYDQPLLGELSGRWYWDQRAKEFRRNRRHSERRRSALPSQSQEPEAVSRFAGAGADADVDAPAPAFLYSRSEPS